MLRGVFSLHQHPKATSLAVSIFSDCCRSPGQRSSTRVPPKFSQHMKHFYSDDASIGYFLGDYHNRTVFCSYSTNVEVCEALAASYLFSNDGRSIEDFVFKERFSKSHPFLMIFAEGAKVLVVSCYGRDDFAINILNPGTAYITNFMIHNVRPSDEESQHILACWRGDFNLYQQTSHALVKALQGQTVSWPPPAGIGMTLLKVNNRATLIISEPGCKKTDSRPKIKGAVSSFNYFCMDLRSAMRGSADTSRLLGDAWNTMTADEKAPYVELARLDQIRYAKEMQVLDAQSTNNGKSKQKPHTAYNLFIVQEKQYLFGLQIKDVSTRMGKHGSDRWAGMAQAEKELYLVQREVELANAAVC